MSELEDLFPPAQYGDGWFLLALGIVAAALLIAWIVLFFTRPKYTYTRETGGVVPEDFDSGALVEALRIEYLHRLQRIHDGYTSGSLDPREANRRLSREVREFVHEYSGFEAPVLGLNDLIDLGVPEPLVDALQRHYYPSIFSRDLPIDPVAGVDAARLVVHSWR